MRVYIVVPKKSNEWVFAKIAQKLVDGVAAKGISAKVLDSPPKAGLGKKSIIHHLSYVNAFNLEDAVNSSMITHIDDDSKLNYISALLNSGHQMAIAMSKQTAEQIRTKITNGERVCYIPPALDQNIRPKKITIGITTRLYPDGRKREQMLVELARAVDLSYFKFIIYGQGWEDTIRTLRMLGVEVKYLASGDNGGVTYERLRRIIPLFDYYLYLGLDEGSLGTLDALAAGVKTIVTPQGFHLDIPNGITHPVTTIDDLVGVFSQLIAERCKLTKSVEDLTWSTYVSRHLIVWQACVENNFSSLQSKIFEVAHHAKNWSTENNSNSIHPVILRSPGKLGGIKGSLRRLRRTALEWFYS
jgi:hypothetical protein